MDGSNDEFDNYFSSGPFIAGFVPKVNLLPNLPPPDFLPPFGVNETDNSSIGIENTGNRTGRTGNRMNSQYNLCGVPGVCNPRAIFSCLNVTVGDCDECSSTASGFFIFIILILGLAIIVGNSLIFLVTAQLHKQRKANFNDWFKTSLAGSDIITGKIIAIKIVSN